MLEDNPPAAILIQLDDTTMAYACHIASDSCGSCGAHMNTIPAMLLYRPALDMYEALCRDCALVVVRAAKIRMEHGESGG